MFKKTSMAGTGAAGTLLYLFLTYFGIDVTENRVDEFVISLYGVISFVWLIWGTFRRKDLKAGLFRR